MYTLIRPGVFRQIPSIQIHKQFIRRRRKYMGFDLPTESVDPTNMIHEPFGRNQKQILRPTKYSEIQLWMLNSYHEPLLVAPLSQRQLIGISGDGANALLNGLITNDLNSLEKERIIFTYALNAKGRILFEMLIYRFEEIAKVLDTNTRQRFAGTDENYVIECDHRTAPDLIKHIRTFMLRRKINFIPLTDVNLFHIYPTPFEEEDKRVYQAFTDPRNSFLGSRLVIPKTFDVKHYTQDLIYVSNLCYRDYLNHHAIPEGPLDITPGKYYPLEFSGDLMNGISFTKGCYLGQELTTRTYYTGRIRKRLLALRWSIFSEPLVVEPGYEIVDCMDLNYKKVGKVINFHNLLSSGIGLVDYYTMRVYPRIPAIRIPPKKFEQVVMHPPFWWTVEQQEIFNDDEDKVYKRTDSCYNKKMDKADQDRIYKDMQEEYVDRGIDQAMI
ncbi:hypothetical protein LOD99_47 [Oopsacas minuta]|uniref:Transferase caf17, mitochondrial n=1 Tax=Oopsacas minuta TaxID=111878 RepID=A0AAV7K7Z0_9METZ|nr:hypothetical protein LOD99_47 [Oopsacas minuta]